MFIRHPHEYGANSGPFALMLHELPFLGVCRASLYVYTICSTVVELMITVNLDWLTVWLEQDTRTENMQILNWSTAICTSRSCMTQYTYWCLRTRTDYVLLYVRVPSLAVLYTDCSEQELYCSRYDTAGTYYVYLSTVNRIGYRSTSIGWAGMQDPRMDQSCMQVAGWLIVDDR